LTGICNLQTEEEKKEEKKKEKSPQNRKEINMLDENLLVPKNCNIKFCFQKVLIISHMHTYTHRSTHTNHWKQFITNEWSRNGFIEN